MVRLFNSKKDMIGPDFIELFLAFMSLFSLLWLSWLLIRGSIYQKYLGVKVRTFWDFLTPTLDKNLWNVWSFILSALQWMRRVSLNTPGVELTNGCCDRTSDSLKNDPIFDACHIRWICQWYQGNICEKCDVWHVRCLSLFSRFLAKKELNFSPIFRSVNDVNTVGTIWRSQVGPRTLSFQFAFCRW